MSVRASRKAERFTESVIREMTRLANLHGAVNLSQGFPDFPAPEQIKRIRSPFEVYQLDAVAYPGNSGSPVYDVRTGRVVGVINSVLVKKTKEAALTDPSGITYAIPVRYVRALLAGSG
mgnify:CR=1 FL=1